MSVFDVDFIDGGFSVEFGDVVETGQALVVAFAGEEELGGLYQEEGHEEEEDEGEAEDEGADVEPILDPGDDGVEHDLAKSPG